MRDAHLQLVLVAGLIASLKRRAYPSIGHNPREGGEGRALCLACLTLGLRAMATRANWVVKEWATRDRETAGRSTLLPAASQLKSGSKVGLESQLYRVLFCLRTSVPRASVLGIVLCALGVLGLVAADL